MIFNCSHFNPVEFASTTLFASSTCEMTNATGTIASVENGFTYGEIVSSLFMFLTFMVACGILFLKIFKRKNL